MHAEPAVLARAHAEIRALFPSLAQQVNGRAAVFLDGPGGTQVPRPVMDAMTAYFSRDNANLGGAFATSQRTVEGVAAARQAMATFLGAVRPEEIVFGQNMTSLTFSLSHALRRTWNAGDEVIVTSLDHDANVAPWTQAAADAGVVVRTWEFDTETFHLPLSRLEGLLNEGTRLVAFTHASNIIGSITEAANAVRLVRERAPRAMVFIDAVHYTPHAPVDVQALDCDFLACSAYKFCGPHLGILYGKYEHLDRLSAYKVNASTNAPPGKWETGTQSFESIAGLRACLDYLAQLGGSVDTADRFVHAMRAVRGYEATLSRRFLAGASAIPGLRLYGVADQGDIDRRTPTFGITLAGWQPRELAARLGEQGIFVGDGHYYAIAVVDRLGLAEHGGLVRLGFAHYSTVEEVDRVLDQLSAFARRD